MGAEFCSLKVQSASKYIKRKEYLIFKYICVINNYDAPNSVELFYLVSFLSFLI